MKFEEKIVDQVEDQLNHQHAQSSGTKKTILGKTKKYIVKFVRKQLGKKK